MFEKKWNSEMNAQELIRISESWKYSMTFNEIERSHKLFRMNNLDVKLEWLPASTVTH